MGIYGLPVNNGDGRSEGPPSVLLVSATLGGILAEAPLPGVSVGNVEESRSATQDISYGFYVAGLSWDIARGLLYVAHPQEDKITVVDLVKGRVAREERIAARPSSLLEGLLSWLTPSASAKSGSGTYRQTLLSADGSRLYVTGSREEMLRHDLGWWYSSDTPLGLQVIDTRTLSLVHRIELPVSRAWLALDGSTLLLTGEKTTSIGDNEVREYSGLYVYDAMNLEEIVHLDSGTWMASPYEQKYSFNTGYAYVMSEAKDGTYCANQVIRVLDVTQKEFIAERSCAFQLIPIPK